MAHAKTGEMVSGALHALLLFDVCESIDLDQGRALLGQAPGGRSPAFRFAAPEYLQFEKPPVAVASEPVQLQTGEKFTSTVKFYDYGVLGVGLRYEFELTWDDLTALAPRLIGSAEVERAALKLAEKAADRAAAALVKPAGKWMSEDYYVVHIRHPGAGPEANAETLVAERRAELARMVRGELTALSAQECSEVLRGSTSYYPTDLLVAGWNAAVVLDNDEGAEALLQLLEYANSQLLELRFYDEFLTRVLRDVYRKLEERRGLLARWRLAREAARLNALRLDVMELTERADNALKFIGDMYYARVYRQSAERLGVNDYRRLVDEKLKTAGDLYNFMVNEFHQARAFFMEAAIVLILIIDLYFLFREAKLF